MAPLAFQVLLRVAASLKDCVNRQLHLTVKLVTTEIIGATVSPVETAVRPRGPVDKLRASLSSRTMRFLGREKTMLTRYKIAVGTSVWVVLGWIACLSPVGGAELRSPRGARTVARPAAVTKMSVRPTATSVRHATAAEVVEEEVVVLDEAEWVEDDVTCATSCCEDPCAVAACNLFGGGFWFDMEFLLWWRDQRVFPALVTTQPNDGVVPGATVLFGGPVDESARPGGRLEFGLWLDPCQRTAVGARYLAVADATISPEYISSDLAFIARPFVDVSTNPATATAFPVANAAAQPPTIGRLGLRTDSEIQAGDVFFFWTLRQSPCASFGLVAGYQFARIDEDLFIESFTQSGVAPATQSIAVSDLFDAQNEFHGGLFGLRGDYRCGQFGVELLGRFGFGNMRQSILISGSTTSTDASGAISTRASGLLAQATTNGGLHEQDKFSFMNEAGVKLAFYPVERLKLSVGYSLMYWSSVVRPGLEIDTSIDGRLLTALPPANATRPAFAFDPTDYLVHGLNFGAELRF